MTWIKGERERWKQGWKEGREGIEREGGGRGRKGVEEEKKERRRKRERKGNDKEKKKRRERKKQNLCLTLLRNSQNLKCCLVISLFVKFSPGISNPWVKWRNTAYNICRHIS